MRPPLARREAVVDTLHGVDVADPYRWLEHGEDAEVQQWVAEQNRCTRSALDAIPTRGARHERLVALSALPVVLAAQVRGQLVVMLEREPGAQQARLVVRPFSDPGAWVRVLADPAADAADAAAAVDWFYTSPDGRLVAYGVSEGGTESSTLYVVATEDGARSTEAIPDCRACSLAWEPDSTAFCYTRYPPDDQYHRAVYQHTVGADWHADPVVWDAATLEQMWPNVTVSPGGRYVLVEVSVGWGRTDLHLLDRRGGAWCDVIVGVDAVNDGWDFIDDTTLIGMTTLDAPMGRVVTVLTARAGDGPAEWTTLVAERDVVLGLPVVAADGCYLPSTAVGVDQLEFVTFDGDITPVDGVGVWSIMQVSSHRSSGHTLIVACGFDTPAATFEVRDGGVHPHHPARSGAGTPALEVSQRHYPSLDGTSIPIFLIHAAGVTPDADTPTILNGYGGFSITETPVWSPMIAAWCESGGTYAIAGLRGGAEYGEAWHHAGWRQNKQNVFDDFHAAADWLVASGYTSRRRLAIAGGSNGGLLVGAAVTQRPDLCAAVWCAVPLLDMVRFPQFLIAQLWTTEYGDPTVVEEFGWVHAYSPYHHVRVGPHYPAVLLTTAEGDTRVDPLHARKMAATLQWAVADQPHARPVLLHQEGRAGHGVGKPVGKRVDEQADVLAFFDWQLDRG